MFKPLTLELFLTNIKNISKTSINKYADLIKFLKCRKYLHNSGLKCANLQLLQGLPPLQNDKFSKCVI